MALVEVALVEVALVEEVEGAVLLERAPGSGTDAMVDPYHVARAGS